MTSFWIGCVVGFVTTLIATAALMTFSAAAVGGKLDQLERRRRQLDVSDGGDNVAFW